MWGVRSVATVIWSGCLSFMGRDQKSKGGSRTVPQKIKIPIPLLVSSARGPSFGPKLVVKL